MLSPHSTLVLYSTLTSQPTQTAHSTLWLTTGFFLSLAPEWRSLPTVRAPQKVWALHDFQHRGGLGSSEAWSYGVWLACPWHSGLWCVLKPEHSLSIWESSESPAVRGCYGNQKLSAGRVGCHSVVVVNVMLPVSWCWADGAAAGCTATDIW